jgi:hypothetical protein
VTGYVRPSGNIEFSGLEPLDGISDGARTAEHHADAGGGKRLVGIRTAIAGEDELHVLARQELARLNPGPTAEGDIGILDGLEVQGVRIDDQEVCAAPKAGINVGIQRRPSACDCDLHQSSFLPEQTA